MKTTTQCLILLAILALNLLSGCEKKQVPVVTTTDVSDITGTTAVSGGNITDEGSSTVLSRGVCWSTATEPTISDTKTIDGSGAGSFSSNITGLNGATGYYVRAYATNSVGTGYGMALSFTTLGQAPTPTVTAATNINVTSATLNGSVNANYLSTVVTFEYGTTTSYGSTATPSQSPLTGNTVTNVSSDITGLTAGTVYHFRIKAVNSLGTTYSNDTVFTTLGQVPTVTTLTTTNVSTSGATLSGSVNPNYLSTEVTFEFGITTSYGRVVTATQSPVTGSIIVNITANAEGLSSSKIYHYRIKAVNDLGTTYGDDQTFTTSESEPVTDIEGNIYNTVTFADQVWMQENLKTTKYRNGDLIGTTNPSTLDLSGESTPKYEWAYAAYEGNVALYGRLYTWYAVTDSRNVCPEGWHVPTEANWITLKEFLINNGYGYEGSGSDIAKSMAAESGWATSGTVGTVGNDQGNNNGSGFTGLAGGYRWTDGAFQGIRFYGQWWSSMEFSNDNATSRSIGYNDLNLNQFAREKKIGFSVRCLKD